MATGLEAPDMHDAADCKVEIAKPRASPLSLGPSTP